ncbi:hypothetical protein CI109_101237 [Kwoniella shandongensis]|uniref:Uncharacterized protein n=1 Tax=Kwoniella shandongensis TaxID=1734106 RepID=A0A5M6BTI2_9TREE|nr:uncharacterized protein CI109_005444 [Kwoniella shandongensis]KAA5526166.1 hypothetical protein CI109_005444 [Kwoniella shandongensis]
MRRLTPSTLRRRVLPPISRNVLNVPSTRSSRTLQTSSIALLPRSVSSRRTFIAPSTPGAAPPEATSPPEEPIEEADQFEEERIPSSSSSIGEKNLASLTTAVTHPTSPTSPLSDELQPVLTHLSTSFLPRNQHLAEEPLGRTPFTHVITFADGRPQTEPATNEEAVSDQDPEAVMALVSPFEGGEVYVGEAVRKLANELEADVVRIDLVMGVGLDGLSSPLGSRLAGPPPLPLSINPLYGPAPQPSFGQRREVEEQEEAEDNQGMPGMAFTSVPIAVLGGGGGGGAGMSPLGGPMEEDVGSGQINEEWISFFSKVINAETTEPGKKRIILLENTIAMSKTFSIWWPSLVEAVRRRRKGVLAGTRNGRTGKKTATKVPEPILEYPTSIVLQCTPSLLLQHTTPGFPSTSTTKGKDESSHASEVEGEHDEFGGDLDGNLDPAQAAISAIEEKFRSMGINVQHHVEVVKPPRDQARLWWSSEESDVIGRKDGNQSRFKAMLGKNLTSVLPPFGARSAESNQPRSNPLRRLLMNRFVGSQSRPDNQESNASSLIWKAFPIIPSPQHRKKVEEKEARIFHRRVWSAALLSRAVHNLGGVLEDPLEVLTTSEVTGRPLTRKTESSSVGKGWGSAVIPWADATHIASIALGQAVQNGQLKDDVAVVKWQDIIKARKAMAEEKNLTSEQIKRYLPSSTKTGPKSTSSDKASTSQVLVDPVVEKIKKAKDLSQHEKRLLPCIVDPSKLASTSFKDVHLPEKTIDGIRSMVSLPLLFPEAFRGGVLKDHATTGALLFGPPGTGKTLLARAVAAESGARMLAIQPSDVNDMYVGEGEKLVKAVFSLARRLSPCVVFLDEVDALFGARISRGSAGSMSHNLLLTEFMQEMDGLSSAIANKDKRLVVVGATNRPYDLDDAVMRRLPRRLLVDLPGVEGRKAILKILLRGETLGEDVNLDRLAKDTDGFSGSDLKHLCVSAALSAVKDTVDVPWRNQSLSTTSSSTSSSSSTAQHAPPAHGGPGGGMQAEVLVVAPTQGDGGGGRRKAKVTRQKTAPMASSHSETLMTYQSVSSTPEDEDRRGIVESESGEGEGEAQFIPREEEEERQDANKARSKPEDETTEDDTIFQEIVGEDSATMVKPKPRVLGWKHFKVALEEIRPSSSEEGSLPELRKWAEQFGEGGTRKGKKSGFGKGFGFGDLPSKDRESGYGRVQQDE